MLERPAVETTDAPESKSRRYALGRRQIAELAPAWRNLTDLVAPLASAAVRARVGVDLDTKIVKGAETVAKNGDIELDVRSMAGTEALSIACSELLAYYVPIGGADHPAAPAAMTLFGLVSVVALASMRGDGRSAPHAPDEGAADARVSEAG